jgi:hypothetical protein
VVVSGSDLQSADTLCARHFRQLLPGATSLRRDDVAIRPSGHQAILHLAARRQFVSEPQPEDQQHDRDAKACYGATPASVLFGIGHRLATPVAVDLNILRFGLLSPICSKK